MTIELNKHSRLSEDDVRELRTSQLVVYLAKWAAHQASDFENPEIKTYNACLIAAELNRRVPRDDDKREK